MRRTSLTGSTIFFALVGARVCVAASVGVPSAVPASVIVNAPTSVTVTISIPDPSVIAAGVNLLRLSPNSQTSSVVSQLHDDGQNGDIVAGDGVYTSRLILNEPIPTIVRLQVSAAFRGVLKRTLSTPFTVAVMTTGTLSLPPDPGPLGIATLGGVDSDGDGVRDDVQRFIALTYPSSAKIRAALTQLAKSYLTLIIDSADKQLAVADSASLSYALNCLFYTSPATAGDMLSQLESQELNTVARINSYLVSETGSGSRFIRLPTSQERKSFCAIDPDTLPN